jgi:nitrogen fixation/metabolism regulation signal transduction histidine kinase
MVDRSKQSAEVTCGAESLSQRVLDSLTAEIAVLDQAGTIIAVNKAWRQFAAENGGTDEATGVGVNYLDVCYAARGADAYAGTQVADGVKRVLDGSEDVFKFEYPCHSATKTRWFLLHVSRLDATDSHVVMTHLSITERKSTEQKLVVAERLAAIGEAMKGLSHEGRNALQRAQAHIALLQFYVQESPEAIELLHKIETAQDKMLGLYEEVKRYASPIHLQIEPCDLEKLIEDVWKQIALPAKPVIFSQSSIVTRPICDIDRKTITYVFQVLFENALAATTDHPRIDVAILEDHLDGQSALSVVVSDNGTGIGEEDREQAFLPFYTTKTKGTGLGLTLARRIVAEHHGRIQFGQPRLDGASVYVTLPRRRLSR